MKRNNRPKQVNAPPGRAEYSGSMTDYQVNGASHRGKRYQLVEHDFLNNRQNFLYHRALFGLSVYTQLEIKEMRKDQRERIKKVHKRTQNVLNMWKQEMINQFTNRFFQKYFPKSPLTHSLVMKTNVDPTFKCTLSFKTLKIDKKQVVDKLITEGILPHNFYELKPEPVCK